MKKERFKEIISNYSSTNDELGSLKKLANEYPFSQIIHLLLANSSKKNNSQGFKPSLQNAAFYTTDRSILKSLIENNLVPSESKAALHSTPNFSNKVKANVTKLEKPIQRLTATDSDKLIAEVLKNLNILQKIKKETAILFENKPELKPPSKKITAKKVVIKEKVKKKTTKPRTQTKIIEKFIKEEPRITKNAKSVNEKQDMSKASATMRDDVISEPLAKIFVKQGKIEKAIDIYKKLIWKYPQKKALFAAQIEKLKKK